MTTDYQTTNYKGYEITSYKARTNYGHYRISKVVRPDGSEVDGTRNGWGWKFRNHARGYWENKNIGQSHQACVNYVKSRIDHEIAGTEHPSDKFKRLQAECRKIGDKAFTEKYGLVAGINCLG